MRVFTQVASPRRRRQYQFSMVAFTHPLWRFLCLYGALYAGFGVLSPYLPTLLESRNLGPEAIALVLGAGTAIRLIAGPVAGRLADILDAPKAVLAACSVAAALIALGSLQGTGLLLLFVVGVLQSAALAPLAPLTDTLALASAAPHPSEDSCPATFPLWLAAWWWLRGVHLRNPAFRSGHRAIRDYGGCLAQCRAAHRDRICRSPRASSAA